MGQFPDSDPKPPGNPEAISVVKIKNYNNAMGPKTINIAVYSNIKKPQPFFKTNSLLVNTNKVSLKTQWKYLQVGPGGSK